MSGFKPVLALSTTASWWHPGNTFATRDHSLDGAMTAMLPADHGSEPGVLDDTAQCGTEHREYIKLSRAQPRCCRRDRRCVRVDLCGDCMEFAHLGER